MFQRPIILGDCACAMAAKHTININITSHILLLMLAPGIPIPKKSNHESTLINTNFYVAQWMPVDQTRCEDALKPSHKFPKVRRRSAVAANCADSAAMRRDRPTSSH